MMKGYAILFMIVVVGWTWYFGVTSGAGMRGLEWSLFFLGFIWLFLRKRGGGRKPPLFWVAIVPAVLILLQGWWMVWNAEGVYHTTLSELAPVERPFPHLPGAFDEVSSTEWMWRVSALLVGFWVAIELWQRRELRGIVTHILSLHLVLFCLYGLIIRASGMETMPGSALELGNYFFATFRYHGNAGAYLNLLWPILAAQWMLSEESPESRLLRSWYRVGMVIVTPTLFIHGSRAASLVALLMLGVWIVIHRRFLIRFWQRGSKGLKAILAVLLILISSGVVVSFGLQKTGERYASILWRTSSIEKRLEAYQAQIDQISNGPLLGVGPGSFQWTFPHVFREVHGEWPEYFWRYAHQDYLQTVIEWGWPGGLLWSILVVGPMFLIGIRLLRRKLSLTQADIYRLRGILLGQASVLTHATVDFPMQMMAIQVVVLVFAGFLWSEATRKYDGYR